MSERAFKTNPGINEIIADDPFQVRADRLDAALKAALKAQTSLFSFEREQRRHDAGPDCQHSECRGASYHCDKEIREIRVLAMTVALARWWPLATARRMAEVWG